MHTDQNNRTKVQTRGKHTHRSKQQKKCTNKRKTHVQIKIIDQRYIQEEKHIHTEQNKIIKVQTRGKHGHRYKQLNKGTNKRKTQPQIKTIEQRHKQEENTRTDKNN